VRLPVGSKSDEVGTGGNELVVAVPRDGEIIVRGEQVSMSDLEGIFAQEASQNPEKLVLVQADEEALHKQVVRVMESARKAGLRNLAIATRAEGQ